jgi:hypothetical protein
VSSIVPTDELDLTTESSCGSDVSGRKMGQYTRRFNGCFRTRRGLAMCKVIIIGCDLHDSTRALRLADGVGESVRMTHPTASAPA